MEFSLICDTVSASTVNQGIAFGKSLLKRFDLANNVLFSDSSLDQSLSGFVQASAVIFPVDAIAPPPVTSSSHKTIRRIRKKRRTKRVSFSGDSEDIGDFGRFLLEGDFGGNDGGNDGPFGGGGGFNGGKGWNFGGFGGESWDEPSSWSDPAMEFVYEVICWIALSNCVHFAFKRVVRIVTEGEREKLNLTLSPVC